MLAGTSTSTTAIGTAGTSPGTAVTITITRAQSHKLQFLQVLLVPVLVLVQY